MTTIPNRVLVVGGTGVFGKRLVRHLAKFPNLELFVSSRSQSKAQAFVKTVGSTHPDTHLIGISVDHRRDFTTTLAKISPSIVVDCSGPFQSANFDVARLALEAGSHHIDLADAAHYLKDYKPQLDALALRQGKTGLTGASSTPTLSSCVVQELTKDWQRVDSIDICITPGGKSEVGHSVIEAILSYAGKDILIWHEGKLNKVTGWQNSKVVHVPKLGKRRVAAVETHDPESLGPTQNVRSRVSFSAGLESPLEQWGIQIISLLRKWHLFPNPKSLTPLLANLRKLTHIFTSDCGGMLVAARGINNDGAFVQSEWTLIAKSDHGPSVPILPTAAAVRKLLKAPLKAGAFMAHEHLTLDDIVREANSYDISTNTRTLVCETGLFETAVGSNAFHSLPVCLQSFHKISGEPVWSGVANITGPNWFGPKLIAHLIGFPTSGKNIPVTVSVDRSLSSDGTPSEKWTRNFNSKVFTSVLSLGSHGKLTEAFGFFKFELGLVANASGVQMPIQKWRCGHLPLPKFLAPISETREYEDDQGRFCFDVSLSVPFLGRLSHYQGYLEPN